MKYTLKDHFQYLQWKQDRHDALYHADIYTFTRKNNLTHMTMHLSKYLGKMIGTTTAIGHGETILDNISVDFIIVLMSMANRVNINLAEKIENEVDDYNGITFSGKSEYTSPESALNVVSNYFGQKHLRITDDKKLYLDIAVCIGRLSKAIEALDHMEQYPSREVIEESIHDLFRLIMRFRSTFGFKQLAYSICQRMVDLENKNVLYELMPKYTDGYKDIN